MKKKIMRMYLLYIKKDVSWAYEKIKKEMTVIHWGALLYTFGASSKNYKVAQNFRVLLGEKMKSNLKLLKGKILQLNLQFRNNSQPIRKKTQN